MMSKNVKNTLQIFKLVFVSIKKNLWKTTSHDNLFHFYSYYFTSRLYYYLSVIQAVPKVPPFFEGTSFRDVVECWNSILKDKFHKTSLEARIQD
jgi:hypothetical protein